MLLIVEFTVNRSILFKTSIRSDLWFVFNKSPQFIIMYLYLCHSGGGGFSIFLFFFFIGWLSTCYTFITDTKIFESNKFSHTSKSTLIQSSKRVFTPCLTLFQLFFATVCISLLLVFFTFSLKKPPFQKQFLMVCGVTGSQHFWKFDLLINYQFYIHLITGSILRDWGNGAGNF